MKVALKNPIEGIDSLRKMLSELNDIHNTPYKADVSMEPVSSNKISQETSIEKLVDFHAVTKARSEARYSSQVALKISSLPVFRMNGGTLEEIEQSVFHRIKILQTEERRKKLKV